jgi:hopene-associated glycosyltransferase HpnB
MFWLLFLLALGWCWFALWGRRWRIEPRLGMGRPHAETGLVVAVVPARNEAHELPATLPCLLRQMHPELKVLLVDDHSTDGTAEVARRLAAEYGAADRLAVLAAPDLPAGWMGKVWAQQQGWEEAHRLGANWVWLTDADIRHDTDVLERLLTEAHDHHRDFVSVMARLRCQTGFERLLIPAFTYFFAGLYPFAAVGNDRSSQAGAAGGCMLIRAELLERIGGIAAIRDAVIDDVALGRACKKAGGRLWLGYHPGVVSTRGYDTLRSIWDMVARSAYTQLRYQPLALLGCVIGLGYVYWLPPATILWGSGWSRLLGLLAYAAMVRTYLPMVRYLGCRPAWALLLPVSALLYTGMTISSAWRYHRGTRTKWKDRSYS